jgi:hypothetical protein
VTLLVDTASVARHLSGDALRAWAEAHTAFISSEMEQLAEERRLVADALREIGLRVVMFEDLGGRDEDAETAYLAGVEQSDVYIGIVGDRYGRMLESGRSPTHEEYLHARARGKRISMWVARDDQGRQGNARDFVQELQVFHTTGSFADGADLARRVCERIAELAADDEAPWVKVGDAIFRATLLRDSGGELVIEAEVRNREVARYLEGLRPDQWNRSRNVPITTPDRSGTGEISELSVEARSMSMRKIELRARMSWADGSRSSAFATGGLTHEDLVEREIRAALLQEELPSESTPFGPTTEPADPLAELATLTLPERAVQPVAQLLTIEYLVGGHRASSVDDFLIGPAHQGIRPLTLTYTEARQAANIEPAKRTVEGRRGW